MKSILHFLLTLTPMRFRDGLISAYRRFRDQVNLLRSFMYDWRQYRQYSGLFQERARGPLEARIIKTFHRIEKGLALSNPKPAFGIEAVSSLLADLEIYLSRYGDNYSTQRAINTLREYISFNQKVNGDVEWLRAKFQMIQDQSGCSINDGGTKIVTKNDILRDSHIDLRAFFLSRYSIRQFSPEPIDDELIKSAVVMAKKTPSVCNRESAGVYVASSPGIKRQLLDLQNGNRGFGDQADRILVITSRLDTFLTVGERYQAWIDGGMFSMSLIYALHSLGIGSCCLNWSVEPPQDKSMHAVPGIPSDHAIIMLLAIGNLPSELRVAQSPRRPVDEVLHFL